MHSSTKTSPFQVLQEDNHVAFNVVLLIDLVELGQTSNVVLPCTKGPH